MEIWLSIIGSALSAIGVWLTYQSLRRMAQARQLERLADTTRGLTEVMMLCITAAELARHGRRNFPLAADHVLKARSQLERLRGRHQRLLEGLPQWLQLRTAMEALKDAREPEALAAQVDECVMILQRVLGHLEAQINEALGGG